MGTNTSSNRNFLLLIGIVVIAVVAGSVMLLNKPQVGKTPSSPEALSDQIVRVQITSAGFEPKELLVDLGTTVIWENKTSTNATVNSVEYPDNQAHPFLNLGEVAPESSLQYRFIEKGRFRYYNYLNRDQEGKIEVRSEVDNKYQ